MLFRFTPHFAAALIALHLLAGRVTAEDWPGFRGPTGMGQSAEAGFPLEWSADGKNILWKSPLP
ncbi:MAG TPA: hypothetical protein VFB80_05535, partial [Pirellulaceae bacterium]|nr:hypothetical protein [Pirellulaceae bacterium]